MFFPLIFCGGKVLMSEVKISLVSPDVTDALYILNNILVICLTEQP